MFTGIIEEIGIVDSIVQMGKMIQVRINASLIMEDTKIGDSIAINGVCQTVTEINQKYFSVQISSTTISKTTFSDLKKIKFVNLERAMQLSDRLGGHLVQGHVNDKAVINEIKADESMYLLILSLPSELLKYVTKEGSIAIDGISLTISEKNKRTNEISIRVIPQTFNHTVLKYKKKGDKVNIETDYISRYLETLIMEKQENTLSNSKLQAWGY